MKEHNFNYNIEVKFSKTGLPIPLVKGIHLHSNYNPEREAEGFVTQNEKYLSKSSNILLFGLGFGYHIHQLEFRLKIIYEGIYNIYIIEPNQNVYYECLERNLYSPGRNIKIFCKNSIQDYFEDIDLVHFMSKRPTVMSHPASFNLYNSFFKMFMQHKAPRNISSIINFIENTEFQKYLKNNYNSKLIDEMFDDISNKEYLLKTPDYLFLALREIAFNSNLKD